MARIRTVKPEWLDDERMALASDAARVASIALILLSDDYGNGRANAVMLGSRIFPGDPGKLRGVLAELQSMGFVALYQVREQTYYTIPHWPDHQRVDKPGKPHVPGPCEADCVILESPEKVTGTPRPDLRTYGPKDLRTYGPTLLLTGSPEASETGKQVKVKVKKDHPWLDVYRAYPLKRGKSPGLKRLAKLSPDRSTVMAAAREMGRLWAGTKDKTYCPQFSTWVNREAWTDDEQQGPSDDSAGGNEPTRKIRLL